MWVIILLYIRIVLGSVSLGFPFDEQLPNVARINQPYEFTMSNSTYESSLGESIHYQVSGLPEWLSFDINSRTFSGTPNDTDVGEFSITLSGSDSMDTFTENYNMLVSNDTGLQLSSSNVIFVEISQYGQTNGIDGLVVKEGDQIYIKFDGKVFESKSDSDRPIIAYYGRSADRTSLPNWIRFDSDDLSFSGTVPHVISTNAPSFEYGFSFIGSDYYGYAGAEGQFKIVVGGHQLSTNVNETIKVNGTLGSSFDIEVPILSSVYLDGQLISPSNISGLQPNDLPSYVTFNPSNYSLSGKFPNDTNFDNFTISIFDRYGNSVDLPYLFDSIGSVFTVQTLPSINATKGHFFEYQLLDSLFTDINITTVSATFDANWLTYDENNKTFIGNVPKNFNNLVVGINASSSFDDESKSFQLKGVEFAKNSTATATSSSTATLATSSSTSTSLATTASAHAHKKSSNKNSHKLAIGLGVGIPALLILVAALILLGCCIKRRNKHDDELGDVSRDGDKSSDMTLEATEINGPGFGVINAKPKEIAASNIDKLEKDTASVSSSLTHVDNSDDSHYYDAESQDKPLKSWRANDQSDIAQTTGGLTKSGKFRKSDASLSTVNTDQLFSVRLVEDNSIIRNSNQSSFASGQFMSNNSLNALLRREDSGNFQRLDSDGNIVETSSPKKNVASSGDLEILMEHSHENTSDYPTLASDKSKQSLYDDFKATQTVDGSYAWVDSNDDNTYKYLNNGKTIDMSLSDNSIYKNSENPARISTSSLGKKAKLVEFTRKSSLRESSHQLNYSYEGEPVDVHDGDSI